MRLPRGATAERVWAGLRSAVEAAYAPTSPPGATGSGAGPLPVPSSITHGGAHLAGSGTKFVVPPISDSGRGLEALPELMAEMVTHSAKLSSPWAMGHMGG